MAKQKGMMSKSAVSTKRYISKNNNKPWQSQRRYDSLEHPSRWQRPCAPATIIDSSNVKQHGLTSFNAAMVGCHVIAMLVPTFAIVMMTTTTNNEIVMSRDWQECRVRAVVTRESSVCTSASVTAGPSDDNSTYQEKTFARIKNTNKNS